MTAVKLTRWLSENEHFLGKQVYQHVLTKKKEGGVPAPANRRHPETANFHAVTVDAITPDPIDLDAINRDPALTIDGLALANGQARARIVPLEALRLPGLIDGSQGTNRAPTENNRLGAQNDYQAIHEWLSLYKTHTYQAYRKEAERLLLWCLFNMQKPLSSLTTQEVALFRDFLYNPQPASLWVAPRKYARNHEKWRPFVNPTPPPDVSAALAADPRETVALRGSMSRESIAHTLTVLSGLFEYLTSQQYLLSNPLKGLPRLATNRGMRVNHRINQRLWQRLQYRLDHIPPADTVAYRTGFAMRWFYLTGLRLSELCAVRLGDIRIQENDEGAEAWYLQVTGKGGRSREVYLVKPALILLQHYLTTLGLEPDPRLNDATLPLIG